MNQKKNKIFKRTTSLQQLLNDRIIGKAVDWVLGQKVDEGRVSSMSWSQADQDLIHTIVDNPKAADINASLKDPKFIKFFRSVAQKGLNTADIQMFYRFRDRLPIKQMNWAYDLAEFELVKGEMKSKQTIHAGFYMLEMQTDLPTFQSRVPFELTSHRHNEENANDEIDLRHTIVSRYWLHAISGRVSKRLIWLEHDSYLKISSQAPQALKHMAHLRLSRLTRSFFISRLMKKLGMQFVFTKHKTIHEKALKGLWADYDALFTEQTDLQHAYTHQIRHIETSKVPTRKQQMFNLSRWLK